jgi:hypothetical protein
MEPWSKAGMSNTLPLVAAAAGVPQTADPLRLPGATVVTGQQPTSRRGLLRSLVFHFANIGLDPLSFGTHSCAEPKRSDLPANRQPACFEFQIAIA